MKLKSKRDSLKKGHSRNRKGNRKKRNVLKRSSLKSRQKRGLIRNNVRRKSNKNKNKLHRNNKMSKNPLKKFKLEHPRKKKVPVQKSLLKRKRRRIEARENEQILLSD